MANVEFDKVPPDGPAHCANKWFWEEEGEGEVHGYYDTEDQARAAYEQFKTKK